VADKQRSSGRHEATEKKKKSTASKRDESAKAAKKHDRARRRSADSVERELVEVRRTRLELEGELGEVRSAVQALARECALHADDIRVRRADVEEAQREALVNLRGVEDDLVSDADDLMTGFRAHLEDLRGASRREWARTHTAASERVALAVEAAEIEARAVLHRSFGGIGKVLAAAEAHAVDSMRVGAPQSVPSRQPAASAPLPTASAPVAAVATTPVDDEDAHDQEAGAADMSAFRALKLPASPPVPPVAVAFIPVSAPPEVPPPTLPGPLVEESVMEEPAIVFAPPPTRNGRLHVDLHAGVDGGDTDEGDEHEPLITPVRRLLDALDALRARGAEFVRVEPRRRMKDGLLLTVLRLTVRDLEGWWDVRDVPARARSIAVVPSVVAMDELVEVLAGIARFDEASEVDLSFGDSFTVGGHRLRRYDPVLLPAPPESNGTVVRLNLGAAADRGLVVALTDGWAMVPPVLVAHLRAEGLTEVEVTVDDEYPVLVARTAHAGHAGAARTVAVLGRSEDDDPELDRRTTGANAVTHLLTVLTPETSADELERMLKVAVPYVRRRAAAHPNLPAPLVGTILAEDEEPMRVAAASNPSIEEHQSAAAADDRSELVRASLAANAAIPPDLLARLAFDPVPRVRAHAVHNPMAAPDLLARLANDEDGDVRAAVVRREDVAAGLLRQLAADSDPLVSSAVASHPACPPDVLEELVAVAPFEVLSNPSAPKSLLAAAALLDSPELRARVATNPATPAATRKRLARDHDVAVRAALAMGPGA
jgi:hypothetical protein